jgi:hypothetical protein
MVMLALLLVLLLSSAHSPAGAALWLWESSSTQS